MDGVLRPNGCHLEGATCEPSKAVAVCHPQVSWSINKARVKLAIGIKNGNEIDKASIHCIESILDLRFHTFSVNRSASRKSKSCRRWRTVVVSVACTAS